MDPRFCAQDIIRCNLCEDTVVQMYCNVCAMNLCKGCVGEHISDASKNHSVVPFALRRSKLVYPQCLIHSEENCEMHCEDCKTPVCPKCVISETHTRHHFRSLKDLLTSKKEIIENERKRLQEIVYSKIVKNVADIQTQLNDIDRKYEKLTSEVTKHGKEWHKEIEKVVEGKKKEINKMRNQHIYALKKHLTDIMKLVADVKQSISEIEEILQSNDVSKPLYHEINSEKFTKPPSKLKIEFPVFTGNHNLGKCLQLFGHISPLSIASEDLGYTMVASKAFFIPRPQVKPLLDKQELITTIDTGYKYLTSVTCLSDEEFWTCGEDKIMKLYNLQGKLMKSIETKSGKSPSDIAVTRSGDLIYIDTSTVNIVKNKQIQEMIRLPGWIPNNVCSTPSGDLLVTMDSDDNEQAKVVRYSGSTEKQTIQFDSKGQPLYSSGDLKFINENKNLDICVADYGAHAVVVVNQAKQLRFRYTGNPSTTKGPFNPAGITTDSQSQILTADFTSSCVHILDQDGRFLRNIDNCYLYRPCNLCVDTRDNLFVAECKSGKVNKIKYL